MTGQTPRSRAAADLAELATRLAEAGRVLSGLAQLTVSRFDGLAGAAFRRNVARAAAVATETARDVSLLAGGLAAFDRDLGLVAGLRDRAATAEPSAAERLTDRADRVEEGAHRAWRATLDRFLGPPPEVGPPDVQPPRDPENPGGGTAPLPTSPAGSVRGGVPPPASVRSVGRRSPPGCADPDVPVPEAEPDG